jgi:hypothetical protein
MARVQFSAVGKLPSFNVTQYRYDEERGIIPLNRLAKQDLRRKSAIVETNKVSTKVYDAPKLGWIPFDPAAQKGELPSSAMKDTTTVGAMVYFKMAGVFARQEKHNGVIFHWFSMPGQASLTDVGKPELPVVGRIIEVPKDVNFSIEVVKSRSISLDHYRVYPAQQEFVDVRPGDPRTSWLPTKFEMDKRRYLNNSEYPGELATIKAEDVGIIRGHRVLMLKVNPIQYNPVTHETKAYTEIEVRVRYSKPAQVSAPSKRIYSRHFEKLVKNLALNYQDPKRYDLDIDSPGGGEKEQTGCDYLILTHNTFYNASDANNPVVRLADWKRKKGLKTKIVDVANITNGTTYDGIRKYLKDAYDTWSPAPSYVLLIGDSDLIPVRYLTAHPSHNNTLVGTDLYYSALDGDDYFPDIYLGRISADTMAHTTAAIDKIINYEQKPPNNAGFYQNILFSALFEDESGYTPDGTEDGTEDRPWIENVEDIRTFLLGQNYQVDQVYTTSSGWPGDPASSQPSNYNNGDADGLTNGNLTPVVISIACQNNGWFDNETDSAGLNTGNGDECLAEHLSRNANSGAVAVFAATRNSWTGKNDYMMFGMHKAIWPDYVPNPPVSASSPSFPTMDSNRLLGMGQILTFGKVYMARSYNPDTNRTITFEMYHIFSDPEMPVWTALPLDFDVSHPVGIGSTGEQEFVVKVTDHASHAAVNMARVVITSGDKILAVRETDPSGIAILKLSSPTSGSVDITVTSLGYRPYMGTITVSSSGARINRLDPDNGILGQTVHVGGTDFSGSEQVEIMFDGTLATTTSASSGSFGQTTQPDVDITVPSPHDLGPVNVTAKGKTSNRYGVDVFRVRSQNPIDLYIYDQWDSSTWGLHPGDNPTWDNPSIRLYDSSNNLVLSNNLVAGQTYTIKADVHNDTTFLAKGVKVTFKWANFGLGQPPEVWTMIGTDPVEIDMPASSVVPAEVKWTTPSTGHLCVMADIYHLEDINTNNNKGQENCTYITTE